MKFNIYNMLMSKIYKSSTNWSIHLVHGSGLNTKHRETNLVHMQQFLLTFQNVWGRVRRENRGIHINHTKTAATAV